MRRLGAAGLLALAGLLSAAPALGADRTITAGPLPNTYATTSVAMDQGDTVTFTNSDHSGALHDVTADANGPDGKALFNSALIFDGKSAPVAGVEYLRTGDYAFHCSVHTFMTGTLRVSANGTPKDRPPPDTTPPTAGIAIADSKIAMVVKHKALRATLTTNEPSRFKLAATSGRTTIAKGTFTVKLARRSVEITLTKAGRKLLAKSKRLTVKLKASVNDAADNRSTASATRKLR